MDLTFLKNPIQFIILIFNFFFQWKDIFVLTKTASDTLSWFVRRGNLTARAYIVLLWFISLKYYTHVLKARSSSECHVLYISSAYGHLYMYWYTSVCTYDHNLVLHVVVVVVVVVHCIYYIVYMCQHFYWNPIMQCWFQTDNDEIVDLFFFFNVNDIY